MPSTPTRLPERWLARRRRRAVAWYGRAFRRLSEAPAPALSLFCDCEGHHAGPLAAEHAEAGLNRLLELLRDHQLTITFNLVADLCVTHTDRVRRIVAAGHDIACHGWRHERPRDLSPASITDMLSGAISAFEQAGVRPSGFRSPESAWSLELLRQLPRHGFRWNAERDPARRPYRILSDLVRIGVATDDWDLVDGTCTPSQLMAKWDARLARARARRHALCLGVHEWVFGLHPALADALRGFLTRARADSGLTLLTLSQLAGDASENTLRPRMTGTGAA